ncbi:MAG: hypothetical protein HY365_02825 [Candidatus Aenigmarchaeota archaeon]|nr:hypothetical protein [Candidatus Aenigmarchaeota archaeon]
MRIINVLSRGRYAFAAFAVSAVFFIAYAYIQSVGVAGDFIFWLGMVPPLNMATFLIFSAILGAVSSYQIYLLRQKTCNAPGAAVTSSVGIGGLFISACPACASLGLFILPAGVLTFISNYGIYMNAAGIALLLFVVRYLGGFER